MKDKPVILVDEFQDTNPLQFSLLWSLKNAVPTIVVGDMKQASNKKMVFIVLLLFRDL